MSAERKLHEAGSDKDVPSWLTRSGLQAQPIERDVTLLMPPRQWRHGIYSLRWSPSCAYCPLRSRGPGEFFSPVIVVENCFMVHRGSPCLDVLGGGFRQRCERLSTGSWSLFLRSPSWKSCTDSSYCTFASLHWLTDRGSRHRGRGYMNIVAVSKVVGRSNGTQASQPFSGHFAAIVPWLDERTKPLLID